MKLIAFVCGIFLIFATLCPQSEGLKCYECSGGSESNCYKGVLTETADSRTCATGTTKCAKGIATLANGTDFIMRLCDPSSGCDTSQLVIPVGAKVDCYNCDTELCNSSGFIAISLPAMILTVFVALKLW